MWTLKCSCRARRVRPCTLAASRRMRNSTAGSGKSPVASPSGGISTLCLTAPCSRTTTRFRRTNSSRNLR
uniref:Uncharacterized protein n=1 Tax=Hyaloperonospora arabidopsidis (strain Emoy2) TaxID=559515 RepID=M4B2U3_HYAAE